MEVTVISVSVSVDVPTLDEGIRFYGEAFGFERVSEPYPGVAVIQNYAEESEMAIRAIVGLSPLFMSDQAVQLLEIR
jgi:hypothetical protein